jgi:hypothetical protein
LKGKIMSWPLATIFAVPENFSVTEKEFKNEFLKEYEQEEYNAELYKEATEWFSFLTGDSEGFICREDFAYPEIWDCIEKFLEDRCYKICSFNLENSYDYPQIASISEKTIKEAFLSMSSVKKALNTINRE